MNTKQDKGFTLVELLIVIVILGILATVTVFAVRGITNQGESSACASDEKTLQTAVEAYFAQEGGTTIPLADPDGAGPQTAVTDAEGRLIQEGLIVEASGNFDVSTAGGVSVTTGGDCDGVTF